MTEFYYNRAELASLVDRLCTRANSPLLHDMPQTQQDMRCAALIIAEMAVQYPVEKIKIDDKELPKQIEDLVKKL